ncbi:hypothetical protein E3P99_04025 [Wallemia hederae]|uniref:ABC transporter domain-containing protein n=1 Tax=Wallemia hederae TaxID=1540922 RepID=A0A4T0FF51_9BASI|nr:hypothetical protein E3P99_04025 [Wallemia hederae]
MDRPDNKDQGFVDVDKSKQIFNTLTEKLSRDAENNGDNDRRSSDATVAADEDKRFDLHDFVNNDKRLLSEAGKTHKPEMGVAWRNLTVKGAGGGSTFIKTFPEAVLGTLGPDAYHAVTKYIPQLNLFGKNPPVRTLINSFTGSLGGGEMMLVLGKPGSGCTTFLKALANKREGYVSVDGDVSYGGLSPEEVEKKFRGEVVMNSEEDIHYPTLTVAQTLAFAIRQKVPRVRPNGMRRSEYVQYVLDAVLKMFGIEHTANTLVGNDVVRGVSGGERKRVSIAETLITRASVMCWDNSTRGLDASTAVDYVKSLRIITDLTGGTSVATLYQAGEGIYDLFDKVCLIDEGRCIYFGPANEAVAHFENLGFYKPPRQTSADFLTGITDVYERNFKEGWESRAPKTPEELERAFIDSQTHKAAVAKAEEAIATDNSNIDTFKSSVREDKKRRMAKSSPYTVSYFEQVYYCFIREVQLQRSQIGALMTKYATIIFSALTISSLFYEAGFTSQGVIAKGSVNFYSTVFLCWVQLSEVFAACSGRQIISKQSDFAMYRSSAPVIASFMVDVPVIFSGICVFSVITYFLGSLDYEAGKFWTFFLFITVNAITFNQLFKCVAALSSGFASAIRYSVCLLNIAFTLAGYTIPRYDIGWWFKWITWVNVLPYTFQALMVNQFDGIEIQCDQSDIVPQIPGAQEQYQTCAVQGSRPGSLTVRGEDYVEANYGYSHLWPFLGYQFCFLIGYLLVTALAAEYLNSPSSAGGVTVYAKTSKGVEKAKQTEKQLTGDIEKGPGQQVSEKSSGGSQEVDVGAIKPSVADFTFKDVTYTVQTPDGEKRLLDNITGYVKPGTITALMGASGAGKTTLLNTLSQRMTTGVVTGDMLIDGKPLELNSFQRGTGYVQQGDLHDAFATVRESIEFSAILRQPRETPQEEVLAYVDQIIALLELQDLEDAIIGSPGAGLGVEQRKRVTIAVELAAKPDVLLFLDEPTSGLDSQSAYSIGRFMNKLADAGQAILCTIHQPSSLLFTEFFDRLLLLSPGGKVVYQGPVGQNGNAIVEYFKRIGARPCDEHENVAEYAIEMIAFGKDAHGKPLNFAEAYKQSQEARVIAEEVDTINAEKSAKPQEKTKAMTRSYSQPFAVQTRLLIQRMSKRYWRDSVYTYSQLFITVTVAIMNGFLFFKIGTSQTNLREISFSCFLTLLLPPFLIVSAAPNYFMQHELFVSRESLSKVYSWQAFVMSYLTAELPYSVLNAVIYWVITYWPIGFRYTPGGGIRLGWPAGLTFLLTIAAFIYSTWMAAWMCTMSPTPKVVMNVMPFIIILLFFINGIFLNYAQQPVIWKYTVYYLNPFTYYLDGAIGAVASEIQVQCTSRELSTFNPPPGETCGSYAGAFAQSSGGYLVDLNATSDCQYCPMSSSAAFLEQKHVFYGNGWPWGYFGIFCLQRKIKCDGVKPSRCTACRNKEIACTYASCQQTRLYSIKYVQDLEDSLAHARALLSNTASTSAISLDNLKRKNSASQPQRTANLNTTIPSTDYADLLDEHLAESIDGLYIPPDNAEDGERAGGRFYGKASMRGLFARIESYVGIDPVAFKTAKRGSFWVEYWSNQLSPLSHTTNEPYTHADFGDFSLLDSLVQLYFDKVNVTIPLLNESFRASIPFRMLERGFGSLLMMVLALGSLYSDDKRVLVEGKPRFLAGYHYYATAMRKMPNYTTTSARLEDIQALVLVQLYAAQGVHTKSTSITNGLTILLAQNIGLHNQWMNGGSEAENEARKRAFWLLYIADRSCTACFGAHLLIKDDEVFLDLPQVTGKDSLESVVSIRYFSDVVKLCGIHGEIMNKLYNLSKSNFGQYRDIDMSDIASLHAKIDGWFKELSVKESDVVDDLTRQLRCNLKLAYHNMQIILYRPFMPCPKVQAPTSNLQLASLTICAIAARSIISLHSDIVIDRGIDRCLTDCMMAWCPFWATLILVVDLCDGRKRGADDTSNLEYIKTGIRVLRKGEHKNVLYGRAVDVLLPIAKAVLPVDDPFIAEQEVLSYSTTLGNSQVAADSSDTYNALLNGTGADLMPPADDFYHEMMKFVHAGDINNGQHFSQEEALGDDYTTLIETVFGGDQSTALGQLM